MVKRNGDRSIPRTADDPQGCVEGTAETKERDSYSGPRSLQVREGTMQEVDDSIIHFTSWLVGKLKWVQWWAYHGPKLSKDQLLQDLHQVEFQLKSETEVCGLHLQNHFYLIPTNPFFGIVSMLPF